MKRLAFMLFMLLILVMAGATFIEKYQGSAYIHEYVYGAWWFFMLWGGMLGGALIHIHRSKLYRQLSSYVLHMSFAVILLGALVTALTAEHGTIRLPLHESVGTFVNSEGRAVELPFSVRLEAFDVEHYSGTQAAADYVSTITFEGEGERAQTSVSMNHIGKYEGYRFYQASYDESGSYLAVNYDRWGIRVTYAGYMLLFFACLLLLIDPKGSFRKLMRHPAFRKTSLVMLGILWACGVHAQPRTISKEQGDKLGRLQVEFKNRIMPLNTLALDFTRKISGGSTYSGLSAEQFMMGWLLFPSEWGEEPLFEVPESEIQKFLQLNKVSSYNQFFTSKGIYKMKHYMQNVDPDTEPALHKELLKLNEKIQLVAMLRSGAMMSVFPIADGSDVRWYAPNDSLPEGLDRGQRLFIENGVNLLQEAVIRGDVEGVDLIVDKLLSYQKRFGGDSLIADRKVRAELWYNKLDFTTLLYRINLTLGIVSLLLILLLSQRRRLMQWLRWFMIVQLCHALGFLTVYMVIRSVINGYVSLANGFDTMLFLGWCIVVLTLLMRNKVLFILPFGLLVSGFTMLVASLGMLNPQITPLMPVLNSPYLSIHVSTIMLSYALFAFTFINALLALTVGRHNKGMLERLTVFSRMLLYPALATLAIGIFLGAIWANESWGRYWAWDPKEVWALITMMVYALPLHGGSLRVFRKPMFFHGYLLVAILVVLMTYFGVNFVLGGMHSYVNG